MDLHERTHVGNPTGLSPAPIILQYLQKGAGVWVSLASCFEIKLTLDVLYHTMPLTPCTFEVKDAPSLQCFVLIHSEGSENLLFTLYLH